MADDDQPKSMLNEKRAVLYHALGSAVSQWAKVEYQFVVIFATAAQISVPVAAKVLGNVKTFRLLLDMCHSAVQCRLGDSPELDYWNSLVEYASELSGDRNYMVHHTVAVHAPGPEPEPGVSEIKVGPDAEVKIGPDIRAFMAGRAEKIMPLDQNDLTELRRDFQELIELLNGFNDWLASGEPSPDIYRAPVVRRRPPRNERQAGEDQT